ncbi:hypothetical protein [Tenggerimyces flavus]|uniref:Uncharacterized protein n=1 Tax=Tenggerimyces flavus TaxID=1708749 RepID=A0ABV7YKB0_9ACTN|nr:hypothetical protein [Tenggerimyces flavus]MBM7789591.1 uncharacterized membrane protein YfbV (UPF0208 family) [Tenggerimyces flavus]
MLALVRLGSQPLRLDEARTALLADAVRATGLPRDTSEGPSLFPSSELAPNGLCVLHTPLQFYLAALGRAVKPTPFATRLPFVLVAIAGVWGAVALADRLSPGAGVYTGLLLLQVPVLLLLRQARYYPVVFAARVFALWSLFLDQMWMAALAGLLLAAAEWSGYLATLAASVAGAVFGAWSFVEVAGLSSGICIVLVWAWLRRDVEAPVPLHKNFVDGFLESFWTYFWKLHCAFAPIIPIAIAVLLVSASIPIEVVAGLGWIVLAHLGLRSVTPVLFTRYLTPAVAPAAIAMGLALQAIAERSTALAVVLAALTAATNALHIGPLTLLPPRVVRRVAFLRCPGGSHLAREAPEDLDRRIRVLQVDFVRELVKPPMTRSGELARWLPAGSTVLIGHTEAATLQVAGPHLRVVPWGVRKSLEREHLARRPPDFVVLGDLDRPFAALNGDRADYELRVVSAPDVLLGNGETPERHVFRDDQVPWGVEVHARC